ncbi:hypothetical protein [Saccharomonospora azurea]|uniref:hypothetical protein n=1 Tax=Saccharomonospora azurea TaxID=40988 RepID=UPI0011467281|nr:hypothetical protein [Saccharomonospora azurea]
MARIRTSVFPVHSPIWQSAANPVDKRTAVSLDTRKKIRHDTPCRNSAIVKDTRRPNPTLIDSGEKSER